MFRLILVIILAFSAGFYFKNYSDFTLKQTENIGKISENYFLDHPEILKKMADKLQYQETVGKAVKQKVLIESEINPLFFSPNSPILGNSKGKITLVEFEDYQCINCLKMYPVIKALIAKNPDLKVIVKELPIFGEASVYAAKKAIIASQMGDFEGFHGAMYNSGLIEGQLKDENVDIIVKKLGLIAAISSKILENTDKEIAQNFKLAEKLGIPGTPAFILAKTPIDSKIEGDVQFIPGAVSEATLQNAINNLK